jgi:lysophospholipase L1-like esterase
MDGPTQRRAALALAACSTLLAFAVLEYLVRFLPDAQTMLVEPSSIPGVAYQLVPNMTACSEHGRFPINKWGFRGPEYPMEKPPGVFRLLALGDSVLYGDRAQESDVTQSLGRLLDQKPPPGFTRVESINTSVPSYSTCQELALLGGLADRFSPDLVLVGYVMNDPEGARVPFGLDLATGRIAWYYRAYHFIKQRIFLVKYVVAKLSPLVFRLRGGFTQFGPAQDPGRTEDYTMTLHDPKGPFWPVCARCIAGLGEYQRKTGVPVLFAVFPLLKSMDTKPLEGAYRQVEETAKAAGLETVNLYPYFAALKPEQVAKLAGDGVHPSKEGHLFIADILYRRLAARPALLTGRAHYKP